METAARDKIIESVAVRDNGFEAVMHFDRRLDDWTIRTRVIFSLNGRKMTVNLTTNDGLSRDDYIKKLQEAVSEKICQEVLGEAFSKIDLHVFQRMIK